jgi:hypothetical protein
MNKAGRKTEPGALVNAFHSGVGRMVAHSGSAVLPIAHCGLDSILAARGSSCVIMCVLSVVGLFIGV